MRALLCLPLLAAASTALPQDERAEWLAHPEYVEAARAPAFRELTPEELRASLKVVPSRNFAFFGFNTPELQLHLPAVDNSTYARVEMPEPRLFDAKEGEVGFELERGLHDAETQIVEIRFLAEGGDGPADYARARGELSVRYPLKVSTRSVAAGARDDLVSIDGPYVEVRETPGLAEAPSFSELEPVRAFDSEGRRLVRAPWSGSRFENDVSWQRLAFKGPVSRVEVDRVESWAEVHVRYDVPAAPALPQSRLGTAPKDERAVEVPADAQIAIEVGAAADAAEPTATDADGSVAIPPRERLSPTARRLAEGLDALGSAVPALAIVQLVVFPPAMVTLSVETGDGVQEWTWRDGELEGPTEVNTQWLECKAGMDADALALQRIPAIWDDATRRARGTEPMQIVVGQYPCGVPFINVPFEGGRLQYEGDGRFVTIE